MGNIPKRAQLISARIEADILDQRLPPGHRLGSEAELIERYGVSRAVLREAIRLVERHRLAETRRGMGGGLFVARPAAESIARVMAAYLESIGLEVGELFEARRLIERPLVHFAAVRAQREEVQELEEILAEQPEPLSPEENKQLFERFSASLGALARSPVLALYARTLREATADIGLAMHFSKADQREIFGTFRDHHRALARAVALHAAERAEQRTAEFLDYHEKLWLERESGPRRRRGGKRGEDLAREISAEIRQRPLPAGRSLGTERDLLERFAVSRATFREAVRLLEQHGVAEMLRGRGLIVSEPDPSAVTRSAYAYLTHLEVDAASISEANRILEPAAAALAAARATDKQLAELAGQLGTLLVLDGAATADAARALHEEIAILAQSRALMLFTRVGTVVAWGLDPVPRRELPRDALDTVRSNYAGIVRAIHDRDAERASRLMSDHIEVTSEWLRARRARHGRIAAVENRGG